ncbi:MAG: hypothetical protein O2807_02845 [bacterium]|nr:hypothetical protein [bacterium]
MSILFVFVDGLGLAPPGPDNPVSALEEGPLSFAGGKPLEESFRMHAVDACLGVEGLPQSATGGSTLFTGVNAPRLLGYHKQGFPTGPLRDLLGREGILRKARERGARADFANVYTSQYFDRGRTRHRSVTTVMTESAGIPLKRLEHLQAGEGVYRDFTNGILIERGYEVDRLTPEAAGRRLGEMAHERDILLYEFFQTDAVGHKGTFDDAVETLQLLNRFLVAAIAALNPSEDAFVLCSDHGNIENMAGRYHTRNPVPLLLWGVARDAWPEIREESSIADVAAGVLSLVDVR